MNAPDLAERTGRANGRRDLPGWLWIPYLGPVLLVITIIVIMSADEGSATPPTATQAVTAVTAASKVSPPQRVDDFNPRIDAARWAELPVEPDPGPAAIAAYEN